MNIILHIGQPKTGTSSIQRFLYHNQDVLMSLGYYYYTYDESFKDKKPNASLKGGAFDFYNHTDQLLKLFTNPVIVKKYIDSLIAQAIQKKMHTIIISSELLCGIFSEQHIKTLIQMLNYPVTAVVYLKRPDLYIESIWQQWYFLDYNNFNEYLQKQSFPDYYTKLITWKQNVSKLIVTPFEKRYFDTGLEKHFLSTIEITEYDMFDFDYIADTDDWGQNKGLTPEALNIIMLNKDIIKKYDDRNLLHRFFNRRLSSLLKKEDGVNYNFLTYEQRLAILQQYGPQLKKIAIEFFGSIDTIFEAPEYYTGSASQEINAITIIRALINIGVEQDLAMQTLTERVEALEKIIH